MKTNRVLRIAFLVLLLSLSQGCGRQGQPSNSHPHSQPATASVSQVSNVSPTAGYVDDKLCADCHVELFESYQQVGMARSFYSADGATRIEDFENNHYYHPASDRHYEMLVRDGDLFQRRYQLTKSGERFNTLEVQVDAIMGSGNHIRSYLYRTPTGEMFQMPLAWYAKSKQWRLNPGYDSAEHLGFQRKITRECMFCHNAYPLNVAPGSDAYWQPAVFPKALPHGVGCQRCHGPGEQHIELAQTGSATKSEVAAAVVNPTDLEPGLRDDVCAQCHMQPSSQILSELVRMDRGEYSFRPGEPLDKYRAFLDYQDESDEERFEINHHAYRLRQSECVDQAGAGLSCVSCHDPHRKLPESQRLAHYREACLKCHATAECGPAAEIEQLHADGVGVPKTTEPRASLELADCVSCHMVERRTHDVVHATMTDHKITRVPDSAGQRLKSRLEAKPVPADTLPFAYPPGAQAKSGGQSSDVYREIAGAQLGNDRSLSRLQAYVKSQGQHAPLMPLAELASALRDRGDYQAELDVLLLAVQQYPDHVRANLEMGMALAAAQQHDEALKFYRRALQIGPPLPETYVGIGMTMLQHGNLVEATKQFREAVRLRPLYPEALLNLGIVLFAQQQWQESREYLLRARSADPSFVEANMYLEQLPAP